MTVRTSTDTKTEPATIPKTDSDQLRERLRGMWSGVAAAWGEHASFVDARGAAVSGRMLELAAIRPGSRVLDLACGVGGIGLEAAPLVGDDGTVLQSDVAASMTAIAAGRAAARGLGNVQTQVLDLERIDQPDACFDVVLCREGLMLVPDPARALGEIHRVLAPGGRLVLSVWGPRAENPWLGIVFDTVSEQFGVPLPPPGMPHPFSLEDATRVEELLAAAGFAGGTVERLPTPYLAGSAAEWWDRTAALAGPLASKLSTLSDEAAGELRARAGAAIGGYETSSGLDIPGLSLVASATRPAAV